MSNDSYAKDLTKQAFASAVISGAAIAGWAVVLVTIGTVSKKIENRKKK